MKKNLLQLLRGEKSQNEMASIYGVTQQTWYSWESGRTVPNNEIMLKMEIEFSIPMEVIFFASFNYKMKLNKQTA
mgnify:CR=1 FL=1